jgi:hypothetical protein
MIDYVDSHPHALESLKEFINSLSTTTTCMANVF